MFSIEPKRETIVRHSLTIQLDEAGAKDFIDDATWLQRQVRNIYTAWQKPAPAVAKANRVKRTRPVAVRHVGRPRKTAEKNAATKAAAPDPASFIDCPHGCGQPIKPRGLKKHEHHCPRYQLHKVAVKAQTASIDD